MKKNRIARKDARHSLITAGLEDHATDSSKSVDADLDRHCNVGSGTKVRGRARGCEHCCRRAHSSISCCSYCLHAFMCTLNIDT